MSCDAGYTIAWSTDEWILGVAAPAWAIEPSWGSRTLGRLSCSDGLGLVVVRGRRTKLELRLTIVFLISFCLNYR